MRDSWKATLFAVTGLALLSTTALVGMRDGSRDLPLEHDTTPVAARLSAPTPVPEPVAPPARSAAPSSDVPRLDRAWVSLTASRAGIPQPAMRAYARAQLMAAPGCSLGWTTLAGIGWVESQHGTLGGRRLGADGRPSTPITGPALDGLGKVAAIPADADGAALHGDQTWDHAVGPMQFLPSSWDRWAADGDGDGVLDPQDLDDAAAAAAGYLCAAGTPLTGSAWASAVLTYNHDAHYVQLVYAAAQAYADRTR